MSREGCRRIPLYLECPTQTREPLSRHRSGPPTTQTNAPFHLRALRNAAADALVGIVGRTCADGRHVVVKQVDTKAEQLLCCFFHHWHLYNLYPHMLAFSNGEWVGMHEFAWDTPDLDADVRGDWGRQVFGQVMAGKYAGEVGEVVDGCETQLKLRLLGS